MPGVQVMTPGEKKEDPIFGAAKEIGVGYLKSKVGGMLGGESGESGSGGLLGGAMGPQNQGSGAKAPQASNPRDRRKQQLAGSGGY